MLDDPKTSPKFHPIYLFINVTICSVLKGALQKKNWHLKEDTNNQLLHSENAMKNNHNELLHLTVKKKKNVIIG